MQRLLAFALCLFAAGAAMAQQGPLEVADAWARATPGGAQTAVVYLTIRSPVADRLVGVSTPVAAKAEVHTMTMAGMVMKMRPLPALDIPAGKPVALAPGGLHIMLERLKGPLRQGQSFALDLTFAKAGARQVTVAVGGPGAMGPPR
jgi:periplasmic copper chaperone A